MEGKRDHPGNVRQSTKVFSFFLTRGRLQQTEADKLHWERVPKFCCHTQEDQDYHLPNLRRQGT